METYTFQSGYQHKVFLCSLSSAGNETRGFISQNNQALNSIFLVIYERNFKIVSKAFLAGPCKTFEVKKKKFLVVMKVVFEGHFGNQQ